ncbi:MAG TPA: hypothetical protein VFI26_08010 [Lysobacter sp.]|nr:hypothetical protein [Lysobacter sp.]
MVHPDAPICDASRMRRSPFPRWFACALVAAALLAACSEEREPFARMSGLMTDEALGEISGMAASRRHADVLWMENDGGNAPMLYAVSPRGSLLARDRVEGVANTDWEDLAAFDLDGRHYILVADTGDNGGLRRTLQLHAIEEPASLEDTVLRPAWSVSFRWPDGPRDCEAAFVDAAAGKVLLVSKKRHPPELFEVPLQPPAGKTVVARRIGSLAGVPRPDARSLRDRPRAARLVGQVTSADVSPDGRTLAVLTYQNVLFYPRGETEGWAQAVARQPRIEPLPPLLPQAEALAWTASGTGLYASGEFRPAPVFYLDPTGG